MRAATRLAGCLLVGLVVGCGDHRSESGEPPQSSSTSPPPAATGSLPPALSLPPLRPLSPAEIDRYRSELERLMPEKRVIGRQGAAPPGFDVVSLEGFDHVLIARRTAGGKTEQACVDTVQGGLQFVSGARRGSETE